MRCQSVMKSHVPGIYERWLDSSILDTMNREIDTGKTSIGENLLSKLIRLEKGISFHFLFNLSVSTKLLSRPKERVSHDQNALSAPSKSL